MKRCYKSESASLRQWAVSPEVVEKLFNSYVEWDESDQRKSARTLLDLVAQLLRENPSHEDATATTDVIMKDLMFVIRGTSTKPIIKAAIKACEYLLAKGVLTLQDLRRVYTKSCSQENSMKGPSVWPKFFAELLQWIRVPTVCPLAGKLVVALYRALRAEDHTSDLYLQVDTFKHWLLDLLIQDTAMLEPIKNYIFGPLFKGDRQEAINFLKSLDLGQLTNLKDGLNLPQLFQLAALEAGKRVGFVEEPGKIASRQTYFRWSR